MNWKKFFFAFIAAFGFMFRLASFGTEADAWGASGSADTWRTEADFGNHFSSLVFGHVVMAFFLTLLCARFVRRVAQRVRDVGNPVALYSRC